jgi:eukaryotic-like serine/threonine-protein kinase
VTAVLATNVGAVAPSTNVPRLVVMFLLGGSPSASHSEARAGTQPSDRGAGTRGAPVRRMHTHAPRAVDPEEDYRAGTLIAGKYRLDEEMREGGMCRVWMGVNAVLNLPVAIKFLQPKFRCAELASSLQREARAIAALQHPAIVRVFDSGELSPDNPFIVLERLEGEDLRQYLAGQRRLTADEAVRLLLPIASGMQAAHARGIIHRDLKPENILLSRDDAGRIQPKVLDFGIATVGSEERWQEARERRSVGTVGYMPPEQAFALEQLDHRVDVWSFCAVLYEAIAGTTPFAGQTLEQMRHSLVHDVVPSLAEMARVDGELWAIIERGLRREPEERWATMRELGQALARWLLARGVYEDISGSSISAEWFAEATIHPTAGRSVPTDTDQQVTLPFPLLKDKDGSAQRQEALSALARLEALRPLRGDAWRRDVVEPRVA